MQETLKLHTCIQDFTSHHINKYEKKTITEKTIKKYNLKFNCKREKH